MADAIGLKFELFEKVLMAFGVLYLADLFNVRLLSTVNGILVFVCFLVFIVVYSLTAHLHYPYVLD